MEEKEREEIEVMEEKIIKKLIQKRERKKCYERKVKEESKSR